MDQGRLSLIVPTLGRSPWLKDCLTALRQDGGAEAQIVLVCQGAPPSQEVQELVDDVLHFDRPQGFAAANNLALQHCRGELVATVNDDVLIDRGWCAELLSCLEEHPRAAAVQGIQRQLDDPARLDGWGMGWNRHWQAIQLGHEEAIAQAPEAPREIFGVSATAAIYRRSALEKVALEGGEMFDSRLFAYYEDVHLAVRLRAAGFESWMSPEATARHAGSTSGRQMRHAGLQWIYGNRLLVLMDLLGRRFLTQWPKIVGRDVVDGWRHVKANEWSAVWGIIVGHLRALIRLPGFWRFGAPRLGSRELARFRLEP